MAHSRIIDVDGEHTLTFDCGDLPADEAIAAAGHEPNGYFWEGVAAFLAPELVDDLDFDSEAGSFAVTGERSVLVELQGVLEPVMSDGDEATSVIERAEAEGFDFDD